MKTVGYKTLITGSNDDVFPMPKFLSLPFGSFRFDLSLMVLMIGSLFARSFAADDSNWGLATIANVIWWGLLVYCIVSILYSVAGRGSLVQTYVVDNQMFVPVWYARVLTAIKLVLIGIIVYSLLV